MGLDPGCGQLSREIAMDGDPLAATAETTIPMTSAIEHGAKPTDNGSRITSPCFWRLVPSCKSGLSPRKVRNHVISRVKCKRDIMLAKW
jgi:hypothetical protein